MPVAKIFGTFSLVETSRDESVTGFLKNDPSALKWLAFTFPCYCAGLKQWEWNVPVKTTVISNSDSMPRFFNILATYSSEMTERPIILTVVNYKKYILLHVVISAS